MLIVCVLFMQTYSVSAESTTEPEFVIEDRVLTKYNGTEKDIVIPDSVEVIGEHAFFPCHSMESIVIPNSVKEIQDRAFSCCINLKELKIPSSVKKIGDDVFYLCKNLKTVTMSNSVTEFGARNFYDCIRLEEIKLSNNLTKIPEGTFWGCRSLKEITIPKNAKEIEFYAFNGCRDLSKVVVSSSVKAIDEYLSFSTGKNYDNADLVFYAPKGSYAESYAKKTNIGFKALAINKTSVTLKAGQTYQLYMGIPSNLDYWKSSKSSIASVNSYTGKVTAKKKGTATITGTLFGKKYTCTVKVV